MRMEINQRSREEIIRCNRESLDKAGLTDTYLLKKLKEGLDISIGVDVKSKYLEIYFKSKHNFPNELLDKVGLTETYIAGVKEEIEDRIKTKALNRGLWRLTTSLNQLIRVSFEYRQWRSDVFTRDDFTCQKCGQRGGKLHAHHKKTLVRILQFYEIVTLEEALECEELWNINNGITYCKDCHKEVHKSLKREAMRYE